MTLKRGKRVSTRLGALGFLGAITLVTPAFAADDAESDETTTQADAESGESSEARTGPKDGAAPPQDLSPLTPDPDEFPSELPGPTAEELDALLAQIAALRSRVAALTTSLFSSKLRVSVSLEGEYSNVKSFTVTLDGGVIYRAPERFSASEGLVVYEHAVAPGQHTLGIEIERVDTRGKTYATFQASRFTLVVPDKQRLEARVSLEDDSDMAEDFPADAEGLYELGIELEAEVVE
jgi:hypothetical protein